MRTGRKSAEIIHGKRTAGIISQPARLMSVKVKEPSWNTACWGGRRYRKSFEWLVSEEYHGFNKAMSPADIMDAEGREVGKFFP